MVPNTSCGFPLAFVRFPFSFPLDAETPTRMNDIKKCSTKWRQNQYDARREKINQRKSEINQKNENKSEGHRDSAKQSEMKRTRNERTSFQQPRKILKRREQISRELGQEKMQVKKEPGYK